MNVVYSFAGLAVADFAAARDWYEQLFGRPADILPHATEAVWRLTATSAIYVVQDAPRAGRALVTLALDDLAAHEQRLRGIGIAFTEDLDGAPMRRLVVEDIDANTLTFFQEPTQGS